MTQKSAVKQQGGNSEVRRTKTIDWCLTMNPHLLPLTFLNIQLSMIYK